MGMIPDRLRRLLLVGLAALAVAAGGVGRCQAGPPHAPHAGERAEATDAAMLAEPETPIGGLATFYADDFNGRRMANGQIFDMADPAIAASNRWPLGARLRVRRVAGGPWDHILTGEERACYFSRMITVTVSDRGEFQHWLDLSRAAFALLGRLGEGVIRVTVEQLPSEPAAAARVSALPAQAERCGLRVVP